MLLSICPCNYQHKILIATNTVTIILPSFIGGYPLYSAIRFHPGKVNFFKASQLINDFGKTGGANAAGFISTMLVPVFNVLLETMREKVRR